MKGRHQLLVLTLMLSEGTSELPLIEFTDQPVARDVVDLHAQRRKAIFKIQR